MSLMKTQVGWGRPLAVATAIASHLRSRFINRNRMDWHHLAACFLAIASAAVLRRGALSLRDAAQQGDPVVRADRAAFNQFFHTQNAVSYAEHMVSGFGIALVGFAVLQLAYFAASGHRGVASNPKPLSAWLRWPTVAAASAFAAALVAQFGYQGTKPAIVLATLIAVPLCVVYHERLEQMAIVTPQRMTALAAMPIWLIAELAWKWSRWTLPESHWVVAAQLTGSLLVLLATSAAAGALVRRVRWLALSAPMASAMRKRHLQG